MLQQTTFRAKRNSQIYAQRDARKSKVAPSAGVFLSAAPQADLRTAAPDGPHALSHSSRSPSPCLAVELPAPRGGCESELHDPWDPPASFCRQGHAWADHAKALKWAIVGPGLAACVAKLGHAATRQLTENEDRNTQLGRARA